MSNEKVCRSCGMPMTEEKHFGTNSDGSKNEELCCYCMKDGKRSAETKFCQSCAMPLGENDRGTNADGSASEDYCQYCYKDGNFTGEMSMEDMIAFCAPMTAEALKISTDEATKQMMEYFPRMKRWAK